MPGKPVRLKLAILNDSQQVLRMLCEWFQNHGHDCTAAAIADMPEAHVEIEKFISSIKPDVVVYDVAIPYASSFDLLEIVRSMPTMKSQRFVVTTPNKKELDNAVGTKTLALEIAGERADLERLLKAVEKVGAERQVS
jgi:CheY-like chemotaxis protein